MILSQRNKSSLSGPFAIAAGGTFIVFPLMLYAQMLYDGRLSWPYGDASTQTGVMAIVCIFVFFGLFIASMGLQIILHERR